MRAAEKNGDPRRKAARQRSIIRVYTRRSFSPWPARTRAARRATAVSYHIVRAVWETAPSRDGGGWGKREKERDEKGDCRERRREGRERKKRGRGNDSERGEVAFNQSPASKCTVHVYVYRGGERRARGEVEESGIWFG